MNLYLAFAIHIFNLFGMNALLRAAVIDLAPYLTEEGRKSFSEGVRPFIMSATVLLCFVWFVSQIENAREAGDPPGSCHHVTWTLDRTSSDSTAALPKHYYFSKITAQELELDLATAIKEILLNEFKNKEQRKRAQLEFSGHFHDATSDDYTKGGNKESRCPAGLGQESEPDEVCHPNLDVCRRCSNVNRSADLKVVDGAAQAV